MYWYNPGTGEMDLCVAKSLRLEKAAAHPNGMVGWQAAAAHEVAALKRLAGVPGVVRYRDDVVEPNGAIHIIMQYDSSSSMHVVMDAIISYVTS